MYFIQRVKLFIIFRLFIFLCLNICFLISCGQLQYDNSVAYPLMTVSVSPSPQVEDVRTLVQWKDLIYTAAGSGGILVYRIVGDNMNPVLSLSLTNLYSEKLEEIYVRTVEIVATDTATNLVFSYDTLSGGGIGIAEISDTYTKPLGSLKTEEGLRIKGTYTTYNPTGYFQILAANENIGIVSYEISFRSNSYFEQPAIASLVDFVSLLDIEGPIQQFLSFDAPRANKITNIGQIANVENLVQLAFDNPQMFLSTVEEIPFLTIDQKEQIKKIITLTNKTELYNILSTAKQVLGEDTLNQLLSDPTAINKLLNSDLLKNDNLSLLTGSISNKNNIVNQIKPDLIQQATSLLNNNKVINTDISNVNNILSLSGLQDLVSRQTNNTNQLDNSNLIFPTNNNQTETLFEESLLSNLQLSGNIDANQLHDEQLNVFVNRKPIGNARLEIQKTIQKFGRKFFSVENEDLKNRLLALSNEEMENLLSIIFEQANTAISLIPLVESSGVRISDLYQYWLQGDFVSIINSLDTTIIAELLRKLPRYKVDTDFQIKQTNIILPAIRNMYADKDTIYIAAGPKGIFIIDRLSSEIISTYKKLFSSVTMIKPYTIHNEDYYVVTDSLDGLLVYKKEKNRKIGELVTRLGLVGEGMSVFPYEDILWVADGSNGVLAVRVDKDMSLSIEAELYDKIGIAYYIGTARRREALASFGADGLKRLRITNIVVDGISTESIGTLVDNKVLDKKNEDFIDKILDWSETSAIAQFIRGILLI